MLKGIPHIISPELLKVLMEMGHGDEIVIADGNFPSASIAQRLIRSDGNNAPEMFDAILQLFPLDTFVDLPVALMTLVPGHTYKPTIWKEFRNIIRNHNETFTDFEFIERFAFNERAKKSYAIIATSETALYANIILKKGVIQE